MENQDQRDAPGIEAVKRIGTGSGIRFVPPLTDYTTASDGWTEAEFRCLQRDVGSAVVGYWTGMPGAVSFESWPYTEVCCILTGKVALRDRNGSTAEFAAGESFVVPKDWTGEWITIEDCTKVFVALQD